MGARRLNHNSLSENTMTKVEKPESPRADEQDQIERIVKWIRANERAVAVVGVVIAVVAFGVWYAIAAKSRREAFAGRELSQARVSAEAGNLPLAASDLSRIVSSYGGTKAGEEAKLLLAEVRLQQGQAGLAVADLQAWVAGGPLPEFRSQAYELLGSALEQTGQQRSAGDAYKSAAGAADAAGYKFLSAAMLLHAGRAYAAGGDTTAAISALEQVVRDFDATTAASEAKLRLAELGKYES